MTENAFFENKEFLMCPVKCPIFKGYTRIIELRDNGNAKYIIWGSYLTE